MRQMKFPGILLGLMAIYAASYLVLIQRRYVPAGAQARYRRYDRICQVLFVPAHQFDRVFRPNYWKPAACVL